MIHALVVDSESVWEIAHMSADMVDTVMDLVNAQYSLRSKGKKKENKDALDTVSNILLVLKDCAIRLKEVDQMSLQSFVKTATFEELNARLHARKRVLSSFSDIDSNKDEHVDIIERAMKERFGSTNDPDDEDDSKSKKPRVDA